MFDLSKRERRADGEQGFTLIELLVVVVIIGILIAIAIPVYSNYKKGASDKAAMSDLRGAISALEQCKSDTGSYPTGVWKIPDQPLPGCQTFSLSAGTGMYYYATPAAGYVLVSWNANGTNGTDALQDLTKKVYCYATDAAGQIKSNLGTATYDAVVNRNTCP